MSTQPISDARLAANRANGEKSTGPRTPEGKAAVANNALKHGLRSERNPLDLASETTLPFEHEEFLATLEAFKEDLQPQGILETRLVERLAHIDLRLTRASRMEMTHLDISARQLFQKSPNIFPDEEPARKNWLTTLAFLHNPNAMELISRYESRLTRDFAKTLTQFRQAQKLRIQTQPQPIETTVSHPTRHHVSDDVAQEKPSAVQTNNSAEQTQLPTAGVATQQTNPPTEKTISPGNVENRAEQTQPAMKSQPVAEPLSRQPVTIEKASAPQSVRKQAA